MNLTLSLITMNDTISSNRSAVDYVFMGALWTSVLRRNNPFIGHSLLEYARRVKCKLEDLHTSQNRAKHCCCFLANFEWSQLLDEICLEISFSHGECHCEPYEMPSNYYVLSNILHDHHAYTCASIFLLIYIRV